ncbi:steroidogenic acute regulatory protein, mitochondrial [Acrasis kona]|uniref:Steroidogenic acute regulatory protein, mitochondrial n=1 Tax=Acrasis kona TaxID=1008807 RepID=A0AAW2ZM83_9EUKA
MKFDDISSIDMDPNTVRSAAENAKKFLKELDASNAYEPLVEAEGAKVEKIPPPPVAGTYRMTGIVNASAKKTFDVLSDVNNTIPLSTSIVKIEVLDEIDEGKLKVIHHEHKAPGFAVSARDFIIVTTSEKENDGSYTIVNASVEHPKKPEVSGFVRGHLIASGYFLYPEGDDKCKLVYIIQTDPKGWIPGWVISMANKQLPETFKRITDFISKQ